MGELSIIQKVYDLITWYIPILTHMPKKHKFTLGERVINNLYDVLEELIHIKYAKEKLDRLTDLNVKLDIIRYQTRLLLNFDVLNSERYEYVSKLIKEIGNELGGWIKQQKSQTIQLKSNK